MTVIPLPSRRDRETGGPMVAADLPAQAVSIRGPVQTCMGARILPRHIRSKETKGNRTKAGRNDDGA